MTAPRGRREIVGRLLTLPFLMPSAEQLAAALLTASKGGRLTEVDLCLAALQLRRAVDGAVAAQRATRRLQPAPARPARRREVVRRRRAKRS